MIDEKKHIEDLEELKKYRQLGTVEELAKRIPEEKVLKFYYCESLDKYLVGIRCGTMYYAELTENHCLCMIMSRYLPWGEHIVDETTLWKEHTYPSEPKEIPFDEWLRGYINQQPKLDVTDTNVGKWIPVTEGLPNEYDSIFAKFKGTDIWTSGMYEKISDDVNVTIEYEDGTKKTETMHTVDGSWKLPQYRKCKVIAWMPLPEAYKGEEK